MTSRCATKVIMVTIDAMVGLALWIASVRATIATTLNASIILLGFGGLLAGPFSFALLLYLPQLPGKRECRECRP